MTPTLSLCAQDVKNNDHDQFLCCLFAPENVRESIFALHVFYIETARIRSLVNEPHLGLIRLQWWRDLVEDALKGKQDGSENGTHKEIIASLKNSPIPADLFEIYFSARSFDMEDRAPNDVAELLNYCEKTGGSLAQMKAICLGATNENSLKAAECVGTAMTLCDIVRTLPYQARTGRTKLPKKFALTRNLNMIDFFEFKNSEALNQCVSDLVTQIRQKIKQARDLRQMSEECVRPVMFATIAMEDYLKRLEKVSFDPFNPHIGGGRLSKQMKLAYYAWRGKY
jgi:NADH dehydrogenase [ubiquinone] 1 alpha subcomplex assembly factor 6